MKLREEFVTQNIDDVQFLVPVGATEFSGIVRSNKTAAFIVDMLRSDTTIDEIINEMCSRYDAPRETITADVTKIIGTLRRINAIIE